MRRAVCQRYIAEFLVRCVVRNTENIKYILTVIDFIIPFKGKNRKHIVKIVNTSML